MPIPIRPEQGAPAGLAATPGSGAIVTAPSSRQPSSARLAKYESTQMICDDPTRVGGRAHCPRLGASGQTDFRFSLPSSGPRRNDSDFPAAQPTSSARGIEPGELDWFNDDPISTAARSPPIRSNLEPSQSRPYPHSPALFHSRSAGKSSVNPFYRFPALQMAVLVTIAAS
jgi:hypothetical protein